jgi:hypothetical protein
MVKSKLFSKIKYVVFRLLPRRWREGLLRWIVKTRYKSPPLIFPWDCSAMKKVLTILPEDPIEAFHQINNLYQGSSAFFQARSSRGRLR